MAESFFLPFIAVILLLLTPISEARTKSIVHRPQPAPLSFAVNSTSDNHQNGVCYYTVDIRTSCYSTPLTTDQISLSFGDAYGNQVYAPRLDDPYSRTFERCSTDTFDISGPCTYQICYVYLYRSGYDVWIPVDITIRGYYYPRPVTFYYNVPIPGNVWYGFNYCSRAVRGYSKWGWSVITAFGSALFALAGLGSNQLGTWGGIWCFHEKLLLSRNKGKTTLGNVCEVLLAFVVIYYVITYLVFVIQKSPKIRIKYIECIKMGVYVFNPEIGVYVFNPIIGVYSMILCHYILSIYSVFFGCMQCHNVKVQTLISVLKYETPILILLLCLSFFLYYL